MNFLNRVGHLISPNDPLESLKDLVADYPNQLVFSSSFSLEDQAITHLIAANDLDIEIFSLDTGRLFAETYEVWEKTRQKYGKAITTYCPDTTKIEDLVSRKGLFSFYDSLENRKECCYIRKVEPLQRALAGNLIWITGIRAEHSPNRQNMPLLEWDDDNQILKYHPILHWTSEQLNDFIQKNQIPYNKLHDKGYPSIGCQPCTRAVKPGEDMRAGRWWWEEASKKECGLHNRPQKVVKI
ncbi:MAG: phosphoadenylyl-sulfate reductase [Bernardetiaceae bacterium]|nr:phosphoadenylyl-sulfate reductase [Bernardetiaceae bacterium]